MRYAVIRSGGKQYRVTEGQVLQVERLVSDGKTHTFTDILLVASDAGLQVGTPTVSGVTVSAKVLGDIRGEKIRVSKFKSKVRYRKTIGHRQALTKVQIESINDGATKKVHAEEKQSEAKKPVRARKTVKK